VPITIVIDDLLPISRAIEPIAGKVGIDGSLWGLLLEKAIAKLHGDYSALISGSINQGFQDLLGSPSYLSPMTHFQDKDTLWSLLTRIDLKKAIVVTSWDNSTLIGLETNIHYTIIDLIEPQPGKQLVKLRNPFLADVL
jgi:hypothetical protein